MSTYPKKQNLFWVIVLLLAYSFDLLFWEKEIGVNFAIFTIICVLGGILLMFLNGCRPHPKSLWLIIPLLCFSLFTFLRREQLTVILAYVFVLFSLGTFAGTYQGGRWTQYSLLDYVPQFVNLFVSITLKPARYIAYLIKNTDNHQHPKLPIFAILRGILFATPIVACFSSLLASADPVFNKLMNMVFDLNIESIFTNIFRFLLVMFYAYVISGIFLHIFIESKNEYLARDHQNSDNLSLGFTESTIITGSVSALFLLFVIVQFRYFFGGETNIGVKGYSYSEYARRGFSELNLVAFFSLLLIIALNTLTRHKTETQRKIYSWLSIFMVALVIVILLSSYQRLGLAIEWHGYSRLRLYPRTYLVWLGALLCAITVLQASKKEQFFTFAIIVASMGFAFHLLLLNVDQAIVKHNVPRYLQGKNLNVAHLSSLSTDAIPALIKEFKNPNYPQELHEGVGAILLCYINSNTIKYDNYSLGDDWRSFNLSSWQAHTALKEIEPQLVDYQILKKLYPNVVRTPGNTKYECGTGLGDF